MARPVKIGLDYFPLDINTDDKLELIEAEHGLQGFAIVIKLWQKIYSNGYYIEWNDDIALLFSRRINSEKTLILSVINSCFNRNLLNKSLFDKYGILTSPGIQKRFFTVCKQVKRTSVTAIKQYLLVDSEFTEVISELIEVNSEISTQKKGKEKKGKEMEQNTWRNDFEIFKSEIWREYDTIVRDQKWITEQERLNPGVDILLSIEKSIRNFWGTEAGWKNKKKSKSDNPNWRQTFAKTIDINKVYKPKQGYVHPSVLHSKSNIAADGRF